MRLSHLSAILDARRLQGAHAARSAGSASLSDSYRGKNHMLITDVVMPR